MKTRRTTEDLGNGFTITREKQGAAFYYYASHDGPDGFVTKVGRYKKFSYKRDALAQIESWRREDNPAWP